MATFPLLDVVTCTTGILLSDGGMPGVYRVLGHVLGDPQIMTHQIPMAMDVARSHIIAQYRWLADLDPPMGDHPALKAWCARLIEQRGATLEIQPAENPPWETGRALIDLAEIAGDRPVIQVEIPREDERHG